MKSSAVTAGTNGTATQYNNLREDWMLGLKNATTISYASSMTFDCDVTNLFITGALTGNPTFVFSNVDVGQVFTIILVGDNTARTITYPANIKWPNNTAPTLTGKTDMISFIKLDSTNYLGIPSIFNCY